VEISRRKLIEYGAAGAVTGLASNKGASLPGQNPQDPDKSPLPQQVPTDRSPEGKPRQCQLYGFDMRDHLRPRRLTMAMWDVAYVLRHAPGGAFADYDRVLNEAVERGYNTLRIDPMPQWIDLSHPERVLDWPNPHLPFMPWLWNTAVHGPAGEWMIEFVEKLNRHKELYYTMSGWWMGPGQSTLPSGGPPMLRNPANMLEGAEMWAVLLNDWKQRFGFDRLLYLDIANEMPYFFPHIQERFKKATGQDFWTPSKFSPEQIEFLKSEIDPALALLRKQFPELRFTTSIHGDLRWLDVPLELDCLDVHFYSDADPRWIERTRFDEFTRDHLFETDRWFAEFSQRCTESAKAMAPMYRARQRFKMEQFSDWGNGRGAPITTSEGWASWFYIDNPKLDWSWLLEWAEWSVDDAIACGFWGWTPHNYAQPQFANWKNIGWHRAINERFLHS
jgi:hypothetical protein